MQTLARLKGGDWDESEHPRDEDGKFTDGGGGGGGGTSSAPAPKESGDDAKLDPVVTDVGGDEWNRKTAEKLEREFQAVRPKIEHLEQRAIGNVEDMSSGDEDEDENAVYMPEEWDQLTSDDQQEAEDAYIEHNKDSYYQGEVDNWHQEYAAGEAMEKVAEDFNDSNGNDSDEIVWAQDALDELRDAREEEGKPPIPFDNKQLINAMSIIAPDQHSWPKKDPDLEFDDAALVKPEGFDPDQQTLPGIDPLQPHEMLNEDMRKEITETLLPAFEKQSEKVASDLEPPDYLMDNAKEYLGESWSTMEDSEKFEFVSNSTSILEKYEAAEGQISELKLDRLPTKYDPLNNTSGDDYRRTQALARYLSRERSAEILKERGIVEEPSGQALRSVDSRLWVSWKESSTSEDGKLIQLAAAEELGGRLNAKTRASIEPDYAKKRADSEYASVGGYEGIKALIRAKWEVTQHLLDKAGEQELQLYRGLTLDKDLVTKLFGTKHMQTGRKVGSFTHLPTMDVKRNGAASTTTALTVANGWGAGTGKVTLRAIVPRTAAISIPAYGINIKSEQEVVIAGTAWKGWDVWQGQAPGFTSTPLQKHD